MQQTGRNGIVAHGRWNARACLRAGIAAVTAASAAAGQCEPRWGTHAATPGFQGTGTGGMYWPSGPSGVPCVLVVGSFPSAGFSSGPNAGAFDGERWLAAGVRLAGQSGATALTLWDADGTGPAPARPAVGSTNGLSVFDGADWRAVEQQRSLRVAALDVWDRDGSGPENELLVIGGTFGFHDGTGFVTNITAWNGTSLIRFGEGLIGEVRAVAAWDEDGDGPGAPRLFAGGVISRSGSTVINGVARWNGQAWESMQLPASTCQNLVVLDPDGPGPRGKILVAAGSFGASLGALIEYENGAWRPFAGRYTANVGRIFTFDHDGLPATPDRLVTYGTLITMGGVQGSAIQWDGAEWSVIVPTASPIGSPTMFGVPASELTGEEPAVVAVGTGGVTETRFFAGAAMWRSGAWRPLGEGFLGPPSAMTPFDRDGSGPAPSRLMVGGGFLSIGGVGPRLAAFDGETWSDELGTSEYSIGKLASWDPDGVGPELPRLAATVYRLGQDPPAREYVGYKTFGGWSFLTAGLNSYHGSVQYLSLCTDAQNRLILSGSFTEPPQIQGVGYWNGTAWAGLGVPSGTHSRMILVDTDGPGPLPRRLVGAGSRGSASQPSVQVWTGSAWSRLGSDMFPNSQVYALEFGDIDGDGPMPEVLIVGGDIGFFHDATVRKLAYYADGDWRSLGMASDYLGPVTALAMWDPDGPGPAPRQLIAGGRIADTAGRELGGIARREGGVWHAIGTGLRRGARPTDIGTPTLMVPWDPDGEGDLPERLYITGEFGVAGGRTAGCFTWIEPSRCCPADFNGDQFLDFFDYADFVACFEGGDCAGGDPLAADFNADGFVDFFDYSDFVQAFEAGC